MGCVGVHMGTTGGYSTIPAASCEEEAQRGGRGGEEDGGRRRAGSALEHSLTHLCLPISTTTAAGSLPQLIPLQLSSPHLTIVCMLARVIQLHGSFQR